VPQVHSQLCATGLRVNPEVDDKYYQLLTILSAAGRTTRHIILNFLGMEEFMSGFKSGAGEGNASTHSTLRSQSSPRTQSSLKASSVLGTCEEQVHDGDAGSIHHTPLKFMQPKKDTKKKSGGEYHEERPASRETKKRQSFASASAHGTDIPHLQLGEAGAHTDMRPAEVNLSDIDRLQLHDYAFVLRSREKSWTYAIIADRSTDHILFVVDMEGSIKTLLRKHWLTCMRLVNINKDHSTTAFLPARIAVTTKVGQPEQRQRQKQQKHHHQQQQPSNVNDIPPPYHPRATNHMNHGAGCPTTTSTASGSIAATAKAKQSKQQRPHRQNQLQRPIIVYPPDQPQSTNDSNYSAECPTTSAAKEGSAATAGAKERLRQHRQQQQQQPRLPPIDDAGYPTGTATTVKAKQPKQRKKEKENNQQHPIVVIPPDLQQTTHDSIHGSRYPTRTTTSSATVVSTPTSLDCRARACPPLPFVPPFTHTDYIRPRRVSFDPTIGAPINVIHSNSGKIVHDMPFTDQMGIAAFIYEDRPVKTPASSLHSPLEGILRRHGTKFGRHSI
jgi:hypothetical protein